MLSQEKVRESIYRVAGPLGVGSPWSAFVGSGGSAGLRRFTSSVCRCPCSSGARAVVLRPFVRVSPGGSRSSGVGSFSPVGSAASRSQPHRHETKSASPPVAERKRNQQPRITNAHDENQAPLGLDVRPNKDEVSSPKARPKISSRSAASPSGAVACALNRTTKRAPGLRPLFVERWSPRADADAHARRRPTVGPFGLPDIQVAFQPLL